ncbi:ankyrin repeat-containing domain protein [Annulohypoxylon moriforme]|nr:ankyrin repeat-containing domain protein [Annulohypoxylon moriforme]
MTPLMYACEEGYLEIIKKLINTKNPGHIDAQDNDGRTALHLASRKGYANVVDFLMRSGAAIDLADNKGKTALLHASEAIGSLWEDEYDFGTAPEDKIIPPMGGQYCMVLDLLFRNKANLKSKTKNGETALHLVAKQRDPQRVQLVLNHMYDPQSRTIQDNDGRTALSVAVDSSSLEIIRLLLSRMTSADFGDGNERERKALIWAAEREETHDIAKMILMKRKASQKPKESDSDSWSAIEWAAYREMPRVLWLLLSSSPPTSDTERSRQNALRRAPPQPSNEGIPSGKELRSQRQEANPRVNKSLVGDILRDPPFTQTSRRMEPFIIPSSIDLPRAITAVVQDFEAAVIEFYEGDAGSGFLRRFRSVKEVVYDKGPSAILKETKKNMGGIFDVELPELPNSLNEVLELHKMYLNEKPKFMWVHLPATNIDGLDE